MTGEMHETGGLRIGEVVARTGLTERMIRHYERLGLIRPARSEAGQRLFDGRTLTALATIQLLKRAGMKLETIGRWLENPLDAANLITAQIDLLRAESRRLDNALASLERMEARLRPGAAVTVEDLAQLIETVPDRPSQSDAEAFFRRHFSPDQKKEWAQMMARLRDRVDPEDHDAAWKKLADDIRAALPLDPASREAQAFLQRWDDLLKPFQSVATPEQQGLARTMWTNVDQWGATTDQPITPDVIAFIRAARASKTDDTDAASSDKGR